MLLGTYYRDEDITMFRTYTSYVLIGELYYSKLSLEERKRYGDKKQLYKRIFNNTH